MSKLSELEKENKRRGELLNSVAWQLGQTISDLGEPCLRESDEVTKLLENGADINPKDLIMSTIVYELGKLHLSIFDFIGEEFYGDAGKEVIERLRERLAEKG